MLLNPRHAMRANGSFCSKLSLTGGSLKSLQLLHCVTHYVLVMINLVWFTCNRTTTMVIPVLTEVIIGT